MSQAASQAAAFYRDVASSARLWTVEDDQGTPAPLGRTGRRAMPFWSTLSRVQRIIRMVPAYSQFRPLEVAWSDFITSWLPDLKTDGYLIGVNWSGRVAKGYDLEPDDVVRNVEATADVLRTRVAP